MAESIIKNIVSKETLKAGVILIRLMSLRILIINNYAGAASTYTLAASDRPSNRIYAPLQASSSDGKYVKLGRITVQEDGLIYRGSWSSYNANDTMGNVNQNDITSGIAAWTVG